MKLQVVLIGVCRSLELDPEAAWEKKSCVTLQALSIGLLDLGTEATFKIVVGVTLQVRIGGRLFALRFDRGCFSISPCDACR